MKIIDFEKKGNVVRFYLGEKTKEWGWTNPDYGKNFKNGQPDWVKPQQKYFGDDWDDRPYEHNAGLVYSEFVKGIKDIAVSFDSYVLEPCDDWHYYGNSSWCKEDMVKRKVPCIIIVPKEAVEESNCYGSLCFGDWVGNDQVKRFYFGDEMDPGELEIYG